MSVVQETMVGCAVWVAGVGRLPDRSDGGHVDCGLLPGCVWSSKVLTTLSDFVCTAFRNQKIFGSAVSHILARIIKSAEALSGGGSGWLYQLNL